MRIAIIGLGEYASRVHVPDLQRIPTICISAACRRNPRMLELLSRRHDISQRYTNWRDMLDSEKLDAVIVATPHDQHVAPTIAALKRNLNVLVEKPLALTTGDAKKVVQAECESTGQVMVSYSRRLHPSWLQLRRLIRDGVIGAIDFIQVVLWTDYKYLWTRSFWPSSYDDRVAGDNLAHQVLEESLSWRRLVHRSGGGLFVNKGTHLLDMLLWLISDQPKAVSAVNIPDGLPSDGRMTVSMELARGTLASLTTIATVDRYDGHTLLVVGRTGTLEASWSGLGPEQVILFTGRTRTSLKLSSQDKPLTVAEAFAEVCIGKLSNPSPADEAMRVVAATEGAYNSLKQGSKVELY